MIRVITETYKPLFDRVWVLGRELSSKHYAFSPCLKLIDLLVGQTLEQLRGQIDGCHIMRQTFTSQLETSYHMK